MTFRIPERRFTPREHHVVELLRQYYDQLRDRQFLNIGMRNPTSPKALWWVELAKTNGFTTLCVEAYVPNVDEILVAQVVDDVRPMDVRNIQQLFDDTGPVAVGLWWHGPEHVPKEEVPAVVATLRANCELLILGCPLGFQQQGPRRGNQYEIHRSGWGPSEFQEMGLETWVLQDGGPGKSQPNGHITAWCTGGPSCKES